MAKRQAKKATKAQNKKKGKREEEAEDEDESDDTGTDDELAEALDNLDDEDWDETEEGKGFDKVDEDNYQVEITEGNINISKSSERLQISCTCEILNGDFKGRKLFKHMQIDTEEARSRTRGELARLGIEWPKKKDLPKMVENDLVGSKCEVRVKDSKDGDGQWTNFVKALDDDEIEDDEIEEEGEDEKPSKKSSKKLGKKPSKKDDDEEEEGDDEEGEEDEDEEESDDDDSGDDEESEDDDESEGDEDEDEDEDDGKKADEDTVTVTFKDKDLSKADKKEIVSLAKAHGFDPSDYDSHALLLVDVGMDAGLEDEYDDAQSLIADVIKADKKKKPKK